MIRRYREIDDAERAQQCALGGEINVDAALCGALSDGFRAIECAKLGKCGGIL